jgi:hypothetical protein
MGNPPYESYTIVYDYTVYRKAEARSSVTQKIVFLKP